MQGFKVRWFRVWEGAEGWRVGEFRVVGAHMSILRVLRF